MLMIAAGMACPRPGLAASRGSRVIDDLLDHDLALDGGERVHEIVLFLDRIVSASVVATLARFEHKRKTEFVRRFAQVFDVLDCAVRRYGHAFVGQRVLLDVLVLYGA